MNDSRISLTVPQYFTKFIDHSVDLESTSKVCCPFHNEDTPSFSYNQKSGKWRCFGACKTGGDVIDLHRMNYKLKSYAEAKNSLCGVLGVPVQKVTSIDLLREEVFINEEEVETNRIYKLCLLHADSVDRWLDMDEVMSMYPVDSFRLKDLLVKWGVNYD